MLFRSRDTELYIQTLTEIGLKIKLLGESRCIAVSCEFKCPTFWNRSFWREGRYSRIVARQSSSHEYGLLLLRTNHVHVTTFCHTPSLRIDTWYRRNQRRRLLWFASRISLCVRIDRCMMSFFNFDICNNQRISSNNNE